MDNLQHRTSKHLAGVLRCPSIESWHAKKLEILAMIVVANEIFSRLNPLCHTATLELHRVLEPRAQSGPTPEPMDGLAYPVVFYTCGAWVKWKQGTIDDLLYIPRRWNPTSRDLQDIALCLPPRLVILNVADMLLNRATNVSNLLPFSLSLTQRLRPCPAVTVASWVGLSKNRCDIPHVSKLASLRVLKSASHHFRFVIWVSLSTW